jgi:N-acetylglutamate synthase-like GNAT family acetyltransferase
MAEGFRKLHDRPLCFDLDERMWRGHTLEDPDFDPGLFLGAHGPDGLEGAALGIVRRWKKPSRGFVKFITSPIPELLEELEERLFAKGVSEIHFGASAPLYLFPGVPAEDADLMALLENRGWSLLSDRVNLALSAENACAASTAMARTPECLAIRMASPTDRKKTLRFIEREFTRSWAVETSAAFEERQGGAFCVIAEDASDVVGFAAVHASNPGWFGPMGVAGNLRGKGLGGALAVRAAEEAFDRDPNLSRLLLPWINDKEPFYRKIFGDMERRVYKKAVVKR